ncbi:tetratricopeptide repeat protein [Streptomyces sp. NPDC001537]
MVGTLVRRAYRHAIDQYTQQHSAEDDRTLAAQCEFARWLHVIGEFAEAEQIAHLALDVQQRRFGDEDARTLAIRHLVAVIMFDTGRRDDAVVECQAVLTLRTRVLGEDHPDTAQSRFTLNSMREQLSPYAEVARLRADLQARVDDADLGALHHATLTTRFVLAVTLWRAGLRSQALEECRSVLDGRRRTLGRTHGTTLDTHSTLASWLGQSGNAGQAATAFAELLVEQERSLDPDNPDHRRSIQDTRDSLAYWLRRDSAADSG